MELKEVLEIKDVKERSKAFLKWVLEQIRAGKVKVVLQAKCVCVDARQATPEEVGTKYQVWSHGKLETEYDVQEGSYFVTTLDKNGKPVVDNEGHMNTYVMTAKKFGQRYHKHPNGHYAPDQTPVATILIDPDLIPEEGIELLPPNWYGGKGVLMKGGLFMLPYDPSLSDEEQLAAWEAYITDDAIVDWYPNNEPETYARCNKEGVFADPELRELFGQGKKKDDPEQAG